jgi:hypothetical protein
MTIAYMIIATVLVCFATFAAFLCVLSGKAFDFAWTGGKS